MHIADSGLLQALSAEHPCGQDLEDTQLLASFDGYRLFGQSAPLASDTDWREIRDRSLEALEQSKDFRLLAHLASASSERSRISRQSVSLASGADWPNRR